MDIERLFPDGDAKKVGRTGYTALEMRERRGVAVHVLGKLAGHQPDEQLITVDEVDYTIQLHLEPPKKAFGQLSLRGPKGLQVYLGSEELDALPIKSLKLEAKTHRLVVVDPKTRTRATAQISIAPEKTNAFVIERNDDTLVIHPKNK